MKNTHWSSEEIDRLKQIMTRYSVDYNDGKTSKETKSLIKKWVIKVFKIKKEDL